MGERFTDRLKKVYKKEPLRDDRFGRRPATPREVQQILNRDLFPILEAIHQPTDQDIKEKGDE